jgi:hypothetical protein
MRYFRSVSKGCFLLRKWFRSPFSAERAGDSDRQRVREVIKRIVGQEAGRTSRQELVRCWSSDR